MTDMTMIQAINQALRIAMKNDKDVILMGEDIGVNGGVFRATEGLLKEFGEERVIDTPLSENGIVGMAIGMALYGLKPVAEIQFMDFIYSAYDQIVSEAAKYRYRSGGQFPCHVVIRAPYGGGVKGGLYHSQSTEQLFTSIPGLKVAIPSTPADAMGLLLTAIAHEEDPVLFFEPKRLYRTSVGEIPSSGQQIPFGKARVVKEGSDVSVFAYGAMVPQSLQAVNMVEKMGIHAELIDLRTLAPLDVETVVKSVEKTGRAVVVHEAPKFCGYGAELAATIAEKALYSLKAPILRVTGYDTPFPYALESLYLPTVDRIARGIERTATAV
jgi:2-oxoisovalerate dehydrogenase E1 component beta subunit